MSVKLCSEKVVLRLALNFDFRKSYFGFCISITSDKNFIMVNHEKLGSF